jgi:GWxTD domain-containing protein
LFIILFFLVAGAIIGQPSPVKPILTEVHVIPADTGYTTYISYRIPYNILIFVKEEDHFYGGAELLVEVRDDQDVVHARESEFTEVEIERYDETNSRGKYLEGLIAINLKEGRYQIYPEILLQNTNSSRRLSPFPLEITSGNSTLIRPIVVYSEPVECDGNRNLRAANFENNIPFSLEDYSIALFIPGAENGSLNIKMTQEELVFVDEVIDNPELINLSFKLCGEGILLTNDDNSPSGSLFLVKGFGNKIKEGVAEIEISNDETSRKFSFNVVWHDKPFSLRNPEFAIRLLEDIVPDEDIDDLLDGSSDFYYQRLVEYWNKKDPVENTSFNELMNEFYQRADYAIRNFASVNKGNGAETDRGRVYLKFGKPESIERIYPEKNQILEVWNYERLNKKFVFKDTEGLGNYYLVN